MPQNFRQPRIEIKSQGNQEHHLKITLELLINVTSDGIEASVAQSKPTKQTNRLNDDDKVEFAIPEFKPSPSLDFGEKVGDV